jgi:shikimate dehydrogenase
MIQLGLIGYPLGHSLSPKIHTAALNACGLQGSYALFPIEPDDISSLKTLLTRLRAGELHGLNVTIPHKQNILSLLDGLTETAQAIGAVNTLSMRNGQLIGDNTDAEGFSSDLKNFLESQRSKVEGQIPVAESQKSALVLGAGGSARAVVYALVRIGWKVTVAARRRAQAQEMAKIARSHFDIISLEQVDQVKANLIVNTTPLGMSPKSETSPWPDHVPFPAGAVVYDLVYNPRETRLVREARAAGLPATTGLGMLIEQAALAFEIWTGYKPPRHVLWQAAEH